MKKASSKSPKKSLKNVEDSKNRARVLLHGVENASTFEHPASFAVETGGLDPSSLKHFAANVDISIKKLTDEEMVFDLKGAEPPLANALRRIMIAEIPTIAIEKVTMWQNTSIIPDENLAHRMGLIPIKADARQFEYHDPSKEYTQHDSLKFRLHKICTKKDPKAPMILNNTHDEDALYNNANVFSGDLEWIPEGDQKERLGDVRPLHDDILIAKLRPGQEIEMDLICEKGIGKTHAKWSPVCTAYYRLVPNIRIEEPIVGEDAYELKKLCPNLFDVKNNKAVVIDPRSCDTSRECLRHDKFANKINLGRIKDQFEFHVESLGQYKPQEIILEALQILKEKANKWQHQLQEQDEKEDGEQ